MYVESDPLPPTPPDTPPVPGLDSDLGLGLGLGLGNAFELNLSKTIVATLPLFGDKVFWWQNGAANTANGGRGFGGRMGRGGGSDPTYLQSNNKHTSNNQCKMIMGNIILCPQGQNFFILRVLTDDLALQGM